MEKIPKQASQTWTTSNCFRRSRKGDPKNVTKLAKITSVLKIANEESEKFSKLALQTTLVVSVTSGHGYRGGVFCSSNVRYACK